MTAFCFARTEALAKAASRAANNGEWLFEN
jgi:hypothetical protein